MTYNKKFLKNLKVLLLYIIYFSIVQFIYSFLYMVVSKSQNSIYLFDIISYVLLFSPVIILIWKIGMKKITENIFLLFKKYWIFYLAYILILYFIRNQIILGDKYIEIPFKAFWLDESFKSYFFMLYIYKLFFSFLSAIFFLILPSYVWLLNSKRKF